jgi:hypothetical protein
MNQRSQTRKQQPLVSLLQAGELASSNIYILPTPPFQHTSRTTETPQAYCLSWTPTSHYN